ncbi:MAG: DUF2339 domain-containing protein [Bacteroidota bacterium]|nr:DUF2339 domain-containing protein [Bacteroidota bacterium]
MTSEEKIQLLAQKLNLLSSNLEKQKSDIEFIRQQIALLSQSQPQEKTVPVIEPVKPIVPPVQQVVPPVQQVVTPVEHFDKPNVTVVPETKQTPATPVIEPVKPIVPPPNAIPQQPAKAAKAFNMEEYVGGKLAGIIGIIILVIAIAIGVKYAIDKDLINPLTRIIFGFLAGGILMTFAIILKKKYQLFSAVILGGAVSTLFFTAFAGNAFYEIYPRGFAFALMFVITAFTVFAAHMYNYEIIAVIGLVGAYAIPPLLSDGSGKIEYMYTYMAIINAGILVLSLFKNWTWVKYSAYGLTWILVASWTLNKYTLDKLNMTVMFSTIFFLTFYATFIAYKIIKKIPFQAMDIITLLSNSTIYFGLGYYALNNEFTEKYLGLFCVFNALVHMIVAYAAYSRKVTDKNILYFILALVFTFLTIAIPIQLEGKVVTLCWFAEMAVLYFIGRKFSVSFFKQIAYTVAALGFISLWHDWMKYYSEIFDKDAYIPAKILLNKMFLTSGFAIVALGALWFMLKEKFNTENNPDSHRDAAYPAMKIITPVLFFITVYFSFFFEIIHHFKNWENATTIRETGSVYIAPIMNKAIPLFLVLWLVIYNAVFASVVLFINSKITKSKGIHWAFYIMSFLALFILMAAGFTALTQLRNFYNSASEDYFPYAFKTNWMLNFRYVFMLFTFGILFLMFFAQKAYGNKLARSIFIWVFHLSVLIILSSELVNQMRLSHADDAVLYEKVARRMGFTILWALYSTVLIVFGIARKIKMLRIMGFSLFGITLIKLLIDSIHMSMGYKFVVYISVGVILVTIGFLYQRFKKILFEDDNENKN